MEFKNAILAGTMGLTGLVVSLTDANAHPNQIKKANGVTIEREYRLGKPEIRYILRESDRVITYRKGRLDKNTKLCSARIDFFDGGRISYDDLGCKGKVSSFVKEIGDEREMGSRSGREKEFKEQYDSEYLGIIKKLTGKKFRSKRR